MVVEGRGCSLNNPADLRRMPEGWLAREDVPGMRADSFRRKGRRWRSSKGKEQREGCGERENRDLGRRGSAGTLEGWGKGWGGEGGVAAVSAVRYLFDLGVGGWGGGGEEDLHHEPRSRSPPPPLSPPPLPSLLQLPLPMFFVPTPSLLQHTCLYVSSHAAVLPRCESPRLPPHLHLHYLFSLPSAHCLISKRYFIFFLRLY